jgi:hypothetical protein
MRFQVILNKTIEASSKVTPIRPIDLDEANTKQSSIAAAAAAAATSNTLMAASLTKLFQQQQQSKTAPPALGATSASLVPSLERFSLMDSELNEFSPSSLSTSNPLVRSIITNTLGSTSNSASSGSSESGNSSWWSATAPVLSDPTPKPINKPLGMVSLLPSNRRLLEIAALLRFRQLARAMTSCDNSSVASLRLNRSIRS